MGKYGNLEAVSDMRMLFYKKMDDMMRLLDMAAISADTRDASAIEHYKAILAQIFRELRPKVHPGIRKKLDKALSKVEKDIHKHQRFVSMVKQVEGREVTKFPITIKNDLHKIQNTLQWVIDNMNLKFPTYEKKSESARVKEAIRRS